MNLEYLHKFFENTIDAISVAAFAIDKNHKVIFWNKSCEKLTGIPASEILGTSNHWRGFYTNERPCLVDLVVKGSNEEMVKYYNSGIQEDKTNTYKHEDWLFSNSELKFIEFEATGICDENGELIGAFELLYDVTKYKSLKDKLKATYDIFDKISDGVVITDYKNNILFINKAMEDMSQFSKEELIGVNSLMFTKDVGEGGVADPIFYEKMESHFRENLHWKGEFLNLRKDGTKYQVSSSVTKIILESGEVNYISLVTNITEQLKMIEHLDFMAHYDYLTKLPNRSLLEKRIEIAIKKCEQEKMKCAVLFLDLDKFKNVNDTLGHDAGDFLLKEIASRLQNSIRSSDTVARLGGDEFVILLDSIKDKKELHRMARKILSSFDEIFNILGNKVSISASMGISVYPDDGEITHELLKNADRYMYWNKENAESNEESSIFNDDINMRLIEDLSIIKKLNDAIPGKLEVYFQPQYSSKTKEIFGAEALVRWNDADLGWISPNKFIPLAEDRRMLRPLWELVLDASCSVIQETGIKVSVNLSPTQLLDSDIVEHVEKSINKFKIDPSLLTLEITESAFISNFESTKETLIELKKLGIELALDDFGTGYSTLSYLNQLPFDYLKIDKSFIQDNSNVSIVTSIVDMADKLNLLTIAEGIETLEQLMLLNHSGCSIIQGFYYSKPLDKNAYLEFVKLANKEKINMVYKNPILELTHITDEVLKNNYLEFILEFERFEKSIEKNAEQQNVIHEVTILKNFILSNFLAEEEILVMNQDPDYSKHKNKHALFCEDYRLYSCNLLTGCTNVEVLINFIRRWIIKNILTSEKKSKIN